LFVPQTPEAGQLEILLARLRKLLGEDRVGAPELLDSHRPDAFRLVPFVPNTGAVPQAAASGIHTLALRILRPPYAVRVEIERSRIVTLFLDGKQLSVDKASGPWKISGAWWTHTDWCREEWDVALGGQNKKCCRVAYDPASNCWYLIGLYD
jgi:protein ImuB